MFDIKIHLEDIIDELKVSNKELLDLFKFLSIFTLNYDGKKFRCYKKFEDKK